MLVVKPRMRISKQAKRSSPRKDAPVLLDPWLMVARDWGGLALRLAVVLYLLWCWRPSIVRGQQYTLEGDLHASYYRNGDFHSSRDKRFRVEVDGPKYRIRTVIPGSTNYVEWGCDGQDLYRVFVSPAHYGEQPPKRQPSESAYPLLIGSADGVPPDDGSLNQYVWLAYASHSYFRGLVTNRIEPVWHLDDPLLKASHFTCSAVIETDPLGLPVHVAYFNDGFYRGIDRLKGAAVTQRLPAPYDKGYTNAVFERISSAMFEGQAIPDAFRFVLYATPIAAPVPLRLLMVVEGRPTSRRTDHVSASDFRPQFGGKASVWDSRITGVVPVPNNHLKAQGQPAPKGQRPEAAK
jgi:hypothetical protein